MRCSRCDSEDCIQIEITLKGEESVEFFSCRRCEAKWWERDGDTVTLDDVLTLTARHEGKGDQAPTRL